MGIIDLNKKYELNEIVSGDSIFCATGITSGDIVKGINIINNEFYSETYVTHKSSGLNEIKKIGTKNLMISVSGKHWEEINVNKRLIEKIKSEQNISELIAKLLISRNFDETEIYSIKNKVELSNPFLNNPDFNECFKTLKKQ
jgi:hypothetical protein